MKPFTTGSWCGIGGFGLLVILWTRRQMFRTTAGSGGTLAFPRCDQRAHVLGRFHSFTIRPGELFFERKATTVAAPALFGTKAAARPIMAGERDAAPLAGSRGM